MITNCVPEPDLRSIVPAVVLAIASQGCVSFVFSRPTPEPSLPAKDACPGTYPPFYDTLIGLGLLGGGLVVNGLDHAIKECSRYPNDTSCQTDFKLFIPAIVAAASATYGLAANVVCHDRLATTTSAGWKPEPSR
jgi:hypothetical protein